MVGPEQFAQHDIPENVAEVTTMSLTTIRSATRRYLGEQGSQYLTPSILDEEINASLHKLNSDAKFNRTDVTIGLQTGVYDYTIPSTVMEMYRVRYGSTKTKLDFTTLGELDRTVPSWESATSGAPTKYYVHGNLVGVYPKPNAAAAATVIYVNALEDPNNLTTGGDNPTWLPRRYQETIAKGAALSISGGYDAEAQAASPKLQRLYNEYVAEVNQLVMLADHRTEEWRTRVRPSGYMTPAQPQ
jgi:hypothetical protein